MKLLSFAVVTLAAASAFAAKSPTQYYYQPAAGQSAVEAQLESNASPAKTATAAGVESDYKTTNTDLKLEYTYGYTDDMAFGAYTLYGSSKSEVGANSATASGLGDIFLFMDGKSDMIHYGVDLGVNLTGKRKLDNNSIATNRSSGGLSLRGNVGALMTSGAINYGGDLSYTMPFERTLDNNGVSDSKLSGGNTLRLAGFGEYDYGMGFAGAELSYSMVGDYTSKPATGADTTVKGENVLGLNLYGTYDINDMATGLLSLGFNMHPEHDLYSTGGSKMKAYTQTIVMLGGRFTF